MTVTVDGHVFTVTVKENVYRTGDYQKNGGYLVHLRYFDPALDDLPTTVFVRHFKHQHRERILDAVRQGIDDHLCMLRNKSKRTFVITVEEQP